MHRTIRTTLTVAAAAAALSLVGLAPANAQTSYRSCDALHKDFKHGVAKSYRAGKRQVRDGYGMPAYGAHAQKVYWANHKNLDRDDDGTACEA